MRRFLKLNIKKYLFFFIDLKSNFTVTKHKNIFLYEKLNLLKIIINTLLLYSIIIIIK